MNQASKTLRAKVAARSACVICGTSERDHPSFDIVGHTFIVDPNGPDSEAEKTVLQTRTRAIGLSVLQTRTRTIALLVQCNESSCQKTAMAKIFADGQDLFIETPDGWLAVDWPSTTNPLLFIRFHCPSHPHTIPLP